MSRDEQADKESPSGDQVQLRDSGCDVREAVTPAHYTRTWYLASYLSVLVRLVVPVLAAAYYAWLRNQRLVLDGVRRQLVPAITSLSAVTSPSGRVRWAMRLGSRGDCDQGAGTVHQQQSPERTVQCDVLHDPGAAVRADVIFIHGLHGSLVNTWKQGVWDPATVRAVPLERRGVPPRDTERHGLMLDVPGDESHLASLMNDLSRQSAALPSEEQHGPAAYSPCWPRDWLPLDCPGVRVIALNYTTDPYLWRPVWVPKRLRTGMLERSREMMDHLRSIGVGDHPIIWVGHSKGGVFVKQIIIDAFDRREEEEEVWRLCRNTRGIMFYSVPHRGSSCADINLPLLRQSVELTEVQLECPEVLSLHARFLGLVEGRHLRAEVFSFIETVQTFMTFLYITIVTIESADAGIGDMLGMPLDHRNICKPSSRQCILYRKLAELINRTV